MLSSTKEHRRFTRIPLDLARNTGQGLKLETLDGIVDSRVIRTYVLILSPMVIARFDDFESS